MMLFINQQIRLICKGGARVFFIKVKMFFIYLFLNLFAPLAVGFGIKWRQAYLFEGRKLMKRIKIVLSQPQVDLVLVTEAQNKMIACFEKYVVFKPDIAGFLDWMEANWSLSVVYRYRGEIEKSISVSQRVFEMQSSLVKNHQLDKLNIMFIPRSYAFGSIGVYENLCVYIKAEILSGRPPKKMILLLDPTAPVNNLCYLNYWRRYITLISDSTLIELLSPLEKCLTIRLDLLIPFGEKALFSHYLSLGLIRDVWEKEGNVPLLCLSSEDDRRGRECLGSLGVPQDAWFVCLHVRTPGWRDNGDASADFRNADINTYLPAIEAITSAGGWVIRMGDPGMQPLPDMPMVIDYAHSDVKSDWMDVFLSAKCRFFVGTSSGLCTFAVAFGVPVVMTNMLPPYNIFCYTSKDLFLPKLCWSKSMNRRLSFKELISPPIGLASSLSSYDMLGLKIIQNEPNEIRDLVVEMLERYSGVKKYSPEDEHLQERFRALTGVCGRLYGDERFVANARIGMKFLRKYEGLL